MAVTLTEAVAALDPGSRALLELSLRRRVGDEDIRFEPPLPPNVDELLPAT